MSDVWDEVWADESGRALRVDLLKSGVRVTVLLKDGEEDKAIAKVTISRWRWDRIVKAMDTTTGWTDDKIVRVVKAAQDLRNSLTTPGVSDTLSVVPTYTLRALHRAVDALTPDATSLASELSKLGSSGYLKTPDATTEGTHE